jgi:hypothetical protein
VELLKDILQDPLFGNLGTVFFGIVSIILTVILYNRTKKEKRPRYCTHGTNLFQGLTQHVAGLQLHFPGYSAPIPSLTVTKLLFWNEGKDTINKSDVATKTEPIRVICREGVVILQADIIQANQPANAFAETVAQDRKSLNLTFDHMDKGEGVVLQIFHTGTSDEDLDVRGKIKGAVIQRLAYMPLGQRTVGCLGAAAIVYVVFAIQFMVGKKETSWITVSNVWIMVSIAAAILVGVVKTIRDVSRNPPPPKAFDRFTK